MTEEEFLNSTAFRIMQNIELTLWINKSVMTNKEKKDNPNYKTVEGYLKNIPYKEAWLTRWNHLSKQSRQAFTRLENFDPVKFEHITSIKVTDDDY